MGHGYRVTQVSGTPTRTSIYRQERGKKEQSRAITTTAAEAEE